ncbi:enoyl-CoA hydratase [Candidatus Nitrospira bockiana]
MTVVANPLSCLIESGVATVALNHPPVNALTVDILTQLDGVFESLGQDTAVKAVVITGTGRFFVAGADIRAIAAIGSAQEGMELARRGQAILNKIESLDKPVIAAINGVCLGGGLELALACHIRLAADTARLGQPEINLGIIPGFGGTQRLPRLVGPSKALELILTGDPISATEGKAVGLISQVVSADDLVRHAQGLARRIAAKGPLAVRAVLRAVRQGAKDGLEEGLANEARLFGDLCETEDKREGVGAFLDKRQPQFKGR